MLQVLHLQAFSSLCLFQSPGSIDDLYDISDKIMLSVLFVCFKVTITSTDGTVFTNDYSIPFSSFCLFLL